MKRVQSLERSGVRIASFSSDLLPFCPFPLFSSFSSLAAGIDRAIVFTDKNGLWICSKILVPHSPRTV